MSQILPDNKDRDLHYCDNSHRYLCPDPKAPEKEQEAWAARVRAHRLAHEQHDEEARREVGRLWDQLYTSGAW